MGFNRISPEIFVLGDNIDKALERLKKFVGIEGILYEMKNRRYYESQSQRRKRKDREAASRRLKSKQKNESNRIRIEKKSRKFQNSKEEK